jgi:hypothetical protein
MTAPFGEPAGMSQRLRQILTKPPHTIVSSSKGEGEGRKHSAADEGEPPQGGREFNGGIGRRRYVSPPQ